MFSFIISRWKESLSLSRFRWFFFLGLVFLLSTITAFSFFLQYIQLRPGFVINDPMIARLGPYHLCSPIQFATYVPVVVGLGYLSVYPSLMSRFIWAYSFLLLLRALCLFLVPLEPPVVFLELRDVILEATAYMGDVITKDLFFSGHVATVFLFALLIHHQKVRWVFMGIGAGLGAMLVLQHVHYSIDVLAAPFFSFAALKFTERIL